MKNEPIKKTDTLLHTDKVSYEKCIGCGVCLDVCPVEAIILLNEKAVISDECIECGICVGECPVRAITI